MTSSTDTSVLFVCMGNICRSPTAHAVFDRLVQEAGLAERILIDSAGTHAYHVGNPPDERAMQAALARQYRMDHLTARQVSEADIDRFDYVLAMDRANLEILHSLAGDERRHKPRLFMSYAPDYGIEEVPDPYYGGARGFEQVLDMVEEAAGNLLEDIRERHLR
ncbi:low molecular weight protein-tyrosine-phosphatase [Guyparkeria sp.]|uniref:low molecular weight protein-tyrosine-phosphatase n=1 Tax=Guyparkeria sp. TaxID=2035736 RepID=UPI00356879F6